MTVHLEEAKRGLVIGAQGATVKATQQATGARLTLPQRGVEGPTVVDGQTPLNVLRACALIAKQTASVCECSCSIAGSAELRATLHPTGADGAHRLFETTASEAVGFVAIVLPVAAGASAEECARQLLDDAAFAAGSDSTQCWAALAGDELYVYGMGPGAQLVTRCEAALVASLAAPLAGPSAGAPPSAAAAAASAEEVARRALREAMAAQPGAWHAVLLGGELGQGGAQRGLVEAALRGKPGLGPAAKALESTPRSDAGVAVDTVASGHGSGDSAGDLFLVDGVLLEQLELIASASGGKASVRQFALS